MATEPTKPSESPFCKFPETCDKTRQCENWLRNRLGCQAEAAENETRDKVTKA